MTATPQPVRSTAEWESLPQCAYRVLNFWADWVEPCRQMNDIFADLCAKYQRSGELEFLTVEAEEEAVAELADRFGIDAVPTFVVLKNGEAVDRLDGANPPQLLALVETYQKQASIDGGASALVQRTKYQQQQLLEQQLLEQQQQHSSDEHVPLEARLRQLTTMAPVVLFMKGVPNEPRCGFSRQIVDLLQDLHVSFRTFDILSDEQVRQGLKTYANWPTYPQLWIRGELVGGLDIVREMKEDGSLLEMLHIPKEQHAENLQERLRALTHQFPLMLFLKGSPEEPKCGFSARLLQLLEKHNRTRYQFFDILSDEEVRQGLKTYSDWPTFPQVYVDGQLVGGLDIVTELLESGEFPQPTYNAQ